MLGLGGYIRGEGGGEIESDATSDAMACARLFPFPSLPVAGAPSRACGGGRGGGGVDAKLRVTRSRVVSASFSAGVPSRACGGGGGGGLDTCAPGPRGARKSARPRSTRSRASVTSGAASRSLFLEGALRKSGPSPRARRSTVGSPARAGAPSRLAFASRHRARSTATHAKWRAARPARSARARRIVSDGQFAVCVSQGTASLVVRDSAYGCCRTVDSESPDGRSHYFRTTTCPRFGRSLGTLRTLERGGRFESYLLARFRPFP